MARVLMKKTLDDEVVLQIGERKTNFVVLEIRYAVEGPDIEKLDS